MASCAGFNIGVMFTSLLQWKTLNKFPREDVLFLQGSRETSGPDFPNVYDLLLPDLEGKRKSGVFGPHSKMSGRDD